MQRGEILAWGVREEIRGQTVNHQPPLPAAVASSSSNSSVLSPAASQALTMYMRCLENGGWCRLVLEGEKERQNFKIECREPAPAVTTATTSACPATRRRKRANRPLNPRRQERERRRRAAWLERQESRQQPGPLTTSTPATAREQQETSQQPLQQLPQHCNKLSSAWGSSPLQQLRSSVPSPLLKGPANHSAQQCWRKRRARGQKACSKMTPSKSGT
jgi:hypothetical protein